MYNTTKRPVYYIPFKDALVRTFSMLYYALSKRKSTLWATPNLKVMMSEIMLQTTPCGNAKIGRESPLGHATSVLMHGGLIFGLERSIISCFDFTTQTTNKSETDPQEAEIGQ